MPPANKCVSKVINTGADCHDPQIERAGISIGLAPFITNFRVQEQAFYHDRHSLRQFWILMLRQKASTSRRPNAGGRSAFALRGADTFGLALQLGVAPLVRRRGDKKGDTDVHKVRSGVCCKKGNRKMRQGFDLY